MKYANKLTQVKKVATVAIIAASATFALPASAITQVSDIRVTSDYMGADASYQAYIQLSQIVVEELGTMNNIASLGMASGSGNYDPQSNPGNAIDGYIGARPYPYIYHSSGPTNAFFDLQFATPVDINSVTLFGRSDNCCAFRDIYNISFFGQDSMTPLLSIAGVDATGDTHSATVNVPEPAPLALLGLGLVGFIAARRKSAK